MASIAESVTVLKRSSVAPPPSAVAAACEMSLPLTFLDMIWLHFPSIERLMFYEIPHLSRAHFVDQVIPELERSLSTTLENFLPLAGNLIIPPGSDSGLPEIRYARGDSVTVTFAECNEVDRFGYFTAAEERNCREFHSLIPELFKSILLESDSDSDKERRIPVLVIQVTLFPNSGISIGISNHHTVGDASTIFQFMKTWANSSTSKLLGLTDQIPPPIYDRSIIEDSKGLAAIFFKRWNRIVEFVKSSGSFPVEAFLNKINVNVRKTFVVGRSDVEKLKRFAMKNRGTMIHLSSFTVTCAYVWTCLVKSRVPAGEEVSEEDPEQFSFYAECRGRMDPPLPENYFGNCLTHCETTSEHGKLIGQEGFQIAVELIGKTIHERLKNSETIFSGAENWMQPPAGGQRNMDRDVGVAGSPKYNYYNLDFGWGKAVKFDFVSIDLTGAMSLSGCRESGGGIEVGLSLPKPKMDAFGSIFEDGLNAL